MSKQRFTRESKPSESSMILSQMGDSYAKPARENQTNPLTRCGGRAMS
jgi:hypothetical protein